MVHTSTQVTTPADHRVGALPLAPMNPLPYRQQVKALRVFHTGQKRCATQADR